MREKWGLKTIYIRDRYRTSEHALRSVMMNFIHKLNTMTRYLSIDD